MAALNPFCETQRLVIKVGSALLVDPETGQLNDDWLSGLCADIAALKRKNIDVVLVSSGAIALGRSRLGLMEQDLSLPDKQACAATGQSLLTQAYERMLAAHDVLTAQALLTLTDTEDRRRWLNARSTLNALLGFGVVPIINENDTVATDEIRFGDNDRLAARAAQMLGADTLILLSDIDGLYNCDPRENATAQHIPIVETLSSEIYAMAGRANLAAKVGTGGMVTKLTAARIATDAGCHMCIMDGIGFAPLQRLQDGARSTWFKATDDPVNARRQWIKGSLSPKGKVTIDAGAKAALDAGRSLLAAGVARIDGDFSKGESVSIFSENGQEIARGLVAYDSSDAQKIIGLKSGEIEHRLGYHNGAALIHRDNMVRV